MDDWFGEVWYRFCSGNRRAWSGCKSALDGRRCLPPLFVNGVDGPLVGSSADLFGDGDACVESIPESRPRKWSLEDESRRTISLQSSTLVLNTKHCPSASPLGESYSIEINKIDSDSKRINRENYSDRLIIMKRRTWLGQTCNNGRVHFGLSKAGLSCSCWILWTFKFVGLSALAESLDIVFDELQNVFNRNSWRLSGF